MRANARGALMRDSIIQATIRVMAAEGLARLSFRRVAREAGIGLPLVNYHFPSKAELVAAAFESIQAGYTTGFARAVARHAAAQPASLRDFVLRSVRHATQTQRTLALAWGEVLLEAVRHAESREITARWHAEVGQQWALLVGQPGPLPAPEKPTALPLGLGAMDVVIGLIFLSFAIGLEPDTLEPVLRDGASPLDTWAPPAPDRSPSPARSAKAERTRECILQAAIDLLVEGGPGAVSFRTIADRSGLAASAPAYHFGSIGAVLAEAEVQLVAQSKARYRAIARTLDRTRTGPEDLAEVATTIFILEATRHSRENMALFGNWLEGARHDALRPANWSFVRDQCVAWQRALEQSAGHALPASAGVLGLALFAGKLIRVLSAGADVNMLSSVRAEFGNEFRKLTQASFWKAASQS